MKSDETMEPKHLKGFRALAQAGSPRFPGTGLWLSDLPAFWGPGPTHPLLPCHYTGAAAISHTHLGRSLDSEMVGCWHVWAMTV